ncbi:glycosyl transferase family 1 [Rhizobiaceae bacterium n13]|uniref:Glycosyl transferase family 1 n=1 Tax=Ferirhizobium litorale TaxID=2927786 RepID=A0AAE3QCZ8_9HYPH|nr:glycosyl transferase family 1 [Fererhizobium litorale]MDI7862062.1 glycosyl transferase family 1 [Fererhizobium litorale]MDI7922666.1 glycosyl transferase family 1 [Fererhizobium litorale]
MLHILYLAHDLADPAVRRRVLTLQAGGARVSLAGFRRGQNTLATINGIVPIELGTTADGRFAQRLGAVGKACLTLRNNLRGIDRPDVIVARNLEMLAVANRAIALFGGDIPLAYECLDIHRLMLRGDFAGKAMRWAEAALGKRSSVLITSSPAFIDNYFRPLSGLKMPTVLLENQVLELDDCDAPVGVFPRPPVAGAPWKIGWFGALRCRKSLALLADFSRRMEGRFEIVLRGRPAQSEFSDFEGFVRSEPFMNFRGAYRNPEDLAAIYNDVHFSWAIDFFEEGQNSSWLLPNRLYEGCRHGALPIVIRGTETERFVTGKGIGFVLEAASSPDLVSLIGDMDRDRYLAAFDRLASHADGTWVFDRADCRALVQRLSTLAGSSRLKPLRAAPQTQSNERGLS